MKKLIIISFLVCSIRNSFNLKVTSCDDDKDRVLVAAQTGSVSIGCRANSKLLDCSIEKVISTEKCSLSNCEFGKIEVYDQSTSKDNVCQFELRHLNVSGATFE